MKKDLICVIPARAGSKRIKNKNFKLFCNKPIISQVIGNLKKSNFFSEIFVSTNSNQISKISDKLGVKVLRRSEKLSDDYTDTKTVICDAIKKIKKLNYSFNKVCCIYPTSVFIEIAKLKKAEKILKKNVPYVFSAKEYLHPIYRSFYRDKYNYLKKNFPNSMNKRTQDIKNVFHDAAQFYLGWNESWENKLDIFDKNSKFIAFPKLSSLDIDDYEDWKIAELLWKTKQKKRINI
ncbi:pseudaminic acid cytidylyltransferase [Candidatus Pelagibacter sp. Uisw_099_02]|uniref:pseudaminic acid cytidylyltransferase n=1 Tax=Candidatus Pelagibacter sp. Uisw_099_02 TaxID=3230981 RepID=UPI0039E8CAD8|tara:strand:- start:193 stop:897 length:705 start_codon:yes stop_codon:yes gene_type:complete